MDLLSELQHKISTIGLHERIDGIEVAVRHAELAEKYLSRGRNDQDSDAFNDVIKRRLGSVRELRALFPIQLGRTVARSP